MKGYKFKTDIERKCFNKYGTKYTLTINDNYIHRDSMVLCTCNIHKTSKYVNLRHFLAGETSGCDICLKEMQHAFEKKKFIKKFISKWGDNYSFEKLDYISYKDSGVITCKEHGDFELKQIRYAFDHIPCPECYERHLTAQRNAEYLNRLNEIYGDKYIWITAEFGDYETGKRLITEETKKEMKKVLAEIQDGTFASKWISENKSGGRAHFYACREMEANHQLEEVGAELRKLYAWNNEDKYSETK